MFCSVNGTLQYVAVPEHFMHYPDAVSIVYGIVLHPGQPQCHCATILCPECLFLHCVRTADFPRRALDSFLAWSIGIAVSGSSLHMR